MILYDLGSKSTLRRFCFVNLPFPTSRNNINAVISERERWIFENLQVTKWSFGHCGGTLRTLRPLMSFRLRMKSPLNQLYRRTMQCYRPGTRECHKGTVSAPQGASVERRGIPWRLYGRAEQSSPSNVSHGCFYHCGSTTMFNSWWRTWGEIFSRPQSSKSRFSQDFISVLCFFS